MPDTGNAKDCLELPPTNFSIFTLKYVTWLLSQYSIVFYFVLVVWSLFHSSDFFKFELQSMFMVLRLLVHFDKEINANVYRQNPWQYS